MNLYKREDGGDEEEEEPNSSTRETQVLVVWSVCTTTRFFKPIRSTYRVFDQDRDSM